MSETQNQMSEEQKKAQMQYMRQMAYMQKNYILNTFTSNLVQVDIFEFTKRICSFIPAIEIPVNMNHSALILKLIYSIISSENQSLEIVSKFKDVVADSASITIRKNMSFGMGMGMMGGMNPMMMNGMNPMMGMGMNPMMGMGMMGGMNPMMMNGMNPMMGMGMNPMMGMGMGMNVNSDVNSNPQEETEFYNKLMKNEVKESELSTEEIKKYKNILFKMIEKYIYQTDGFILISQMVNYGMIPTPKGENDNEYYTLVELMKNIWASVAMVYLEQSDANYTFKNAFQVMYTTLQQMIYSDYYSNKNKNEEKRNAFVDTISNVPGYGNPMMGMGMNPMMGMGMMGGMNPMIMNGMGMNPMMGMGGFNFNSMPPNNNMHTSNNAPNNFNMGMMGGMNPMMMNGMNPMMGMGMNPMMGMGMMNGMGMNPMMGMGGFNFNSMPPNNSSQNNNVPGSKTFSSRVMY